MSVQKIINMLNQTAKRVSAEEYSLGKLIQDIEGLNPKKEIVVAKGYGFAGFDSWRGSYCELSLQYEIGAEGDVARLLQDAEDAVGKTMTGYKGGDFVMDKDTPIHIANYGEVGFHHPSCAFKIDKYPDETFYYGAKLIGVEDKGDYYQLKLRIEED